MKSNFKFLFALFSLLILTGLTGCPNFTEPDESDLSTGGILITISGDGVGNTPGTRTLFPSTPLFTRFELRFYNAGGSNTYGPVILNVNESEKLIEDLPVGKWYITAVGFITINGSFVEAADGFTEIDVETGTNGKTVFQSVKIPISAKKGDGTGTFFYDINFPSAIQKAQLFIYDVGGSPWDVEDPLVTTPLGSNTPIDILSSKSGHITLNAGYYMMTMKLSNGFKSLSWTEVIHIYTNMETRMVKVFDDSYISGAITLSGSVNAVINGVQAGWAALYLYTDINCTNLYSYLEANNGQLFPVTMQSFETPITLYLKLSAEIGSSSYTRKLGSITLHDNDHVFNINEVFHSITIGGTSAITINGAKPGEAYVRAYKAENDELLNVNEALVSPITARNGAWEMNIEAFNEPTEVYFIVQAISSGSYASYYKRIDETVRLYNSNRINLHLIAEVAELTVSGTANIKINNEPPQWASITMRKVTANQEVGDWLGAEDVILSDGNKWAISIKRFSSPVYVYFEYSCIDKDGYWHEGKIVRQDLYLYTTNVTTGLDFVVDIKSISVGGTANISINGALPKEADVVMYRASDDEPLGYAQIDLIQKIEKEGGTLMDNPNYLKWRMNPLNQFSAPTTVYFVVFGIDSNDIYFERNAATVSLYNTDVLNIVLNATTLTLSGTVTLNERFIPVDKTIEITAIAKGAQGASYSTLIEYSPGAKNWSINIPPFNTSTEIDFRIRWSSDEESYFIPIELNNPVSIHNTNVSGINLGSQDLYPTYAFFDDGTRWAAGIGSKWLMNGKRFLNGEHYVLTYSLWTEKNIGDLDLVIRDLTLCSCEAAHTCFDNSMLSEIRRVRSGFTEGGTYSGTVVFSINKSASSADKMANAVYFMTSSPDTFIRITDLKIESIAKVESVSKWEVTLVDSIENPTTSRKIDFNIVGAGITTIAEYGSHDAYSENYNDVLYVRPGLGGYYHFVIEYDLSEEYAGKNIRVDIEYDYFLTHRTALAWHINSSNYPTVCGNTNQIDPSNQWRQMRSQSSNSSTTLTVPPLSSPGNTGKMLYLSGMQIGSAPAYLRNFRIAITVIP